jgi:hypothetical protein
MPVWPRVRSATAGLSEPAQHGGGPFYEFRSPGQALCDNRPPLAGLVRMGPGWRGPARPALLSDAHAFQVREVASAAMCVDHAAGPVGGRASMSGDKWWLLSQN